MKKQYLTIAWLIGAAAAAWPLFGQAERFDFIPDTEWFIDSEIPSREDQTAFFRVSGLPEDVPLYRERIKLKTFTCISAMLKLQFDNSAKGVRLSSNKEEPTKRCIDPVGDRKSYRGSLMFVG